MTRLTSFLRDERGATAAEFVLVVPLLALFIFGVIDAAMFGWQINVAEKAAQAGVRMAVVTDPVASALTTEQYNSTTYGLSQGDIIPASALGLLRCNSTKCTCVTTPCPAVTYSSAAFNTILARMKVYDSAVQASNLIVEYRGSGLGYAGDPSGIQIAPITTVRLTGMTYTPLTLFIFKTAVSLPDFASSLTMEDGSGSKSN